MIFAGTTSDPLVCAPELSQISTARAPGPSDSDISPRKALVVSVSTRSATSPTACPVAGQAAVKTCSDSYSVWRTAVGREPVGAQTRVSDPFCPKRASSWKKTSTRSAGQPAATAATRPGAPF